MRFTSVDQLMIDYSSDITTNRAGTVTYYFFLEGTESQGAHATQSLVFTSAGTQSILEMWEFDKPGLYKLFLYIDNPNHQYFGPIQVEVSCLATL